MKTFCPNCGTKLKPGATFCPNCGAKLVTTNNTTKQATVSNKHDGNLNKKSSISENNSDNQSDHTEKGTSFLSKLRSSNKTRCNIL